MRGHWRAGRPPACLSLRFHFVPAVGFASLGAAAVSLRSRPPPFLTASKLAALIPPCPAGSAGRRIKKRGGRERFAPAAAGLCPPLRNRALGRPIPPGGGIFWRLPPSPQPRLGGGAFVETAARRHGLCPAFALSHRSFFLSWGCAHSQKMAAAPLHISPLRRVNAARWRLQSTRFAFHPLPPPKRGSNPLRGFINGLRPS